MNGTCFLAALSLLPAPVFAQEAGARLAEERLSFQTAGPWSPRVNLNADVSGGADAPRCPPGNSMSPVIRCVFDSRTRWTGYLSRSGSRSNPALQKIHPA
jgi:hypothetical protein